MTRDEFEKISAEAAQIEEAAKATVATFNGWKSWNVRIDQGREFGDQIIALSRLVTRLAEHVERLSEHTDNEPPLSS